MQGPGEIITFLMRNQFLSPQQGEALMKEKSRYLSAIQLCTEMVQRNLITPYQQAQLLSGNGEKLIIGSYRIQSPIGEGGMGMVFKAIQPKLDRTVALKVIRPQVLAARPEILSRFNREARAIAQLNHPNLVILFDADEANNTHFIAMEYVEGQTFEKMVRTNGPMGIRQACEYIRQAALGLQHAYEVGLVHRDIKPSNILVSQRTSGSASTGNSSIRLSRPALVTVRDRERLQQSGSKTNSSWGTVKILDMGLARLTEAPDDDIPAQEYTPLTRAGALLGTPDFIAPEQARDARKVDIRADIYSLGCTFYYMLSGKPPFPGGTDVQKLIRHQSEKPYPLEELRPGIPSEVLQIMNRMLEKRAEDRYTIPQHLADAMDHYLNPPVPHTPLPNTSQPIAETPPVAETPLPTPKENTQRAAPRQPAPQTQRVKSEPELGHTQVYQPDDGIAILKPSSGVEAHQGPVGCVACSADGRLVLSGSIDGYVRLWDFTTAVPRKIAESVYRGAEFQTIMFHPKEDFAVVGGSFQGTARVWAWDWRANQFYEWGAYRGDSANVTGLAFSNDGSKFAAAIGAFVVYWKVSSAKSAGSGTILKGHGRSVRAVAFSPDGKMLFSAGESKSVIGWSFGWLGVSQKVRIEGNNDITTTIAVSPDGNWIALGGMDRTVRMIDLARPRFEQAIHLTGLQSNIRLVKYMPDGRSIAAVGESGPVMVWNVQSTLLLQQLSLTTTMVLAAAFAHGGQALCLGSIDGKVTQFQIPVINNQPMTGLHQAQTVT